MSRASVKGAMLSRRPSRRVRVGSVVIGGGEPVTVQSMTTTPARDIDGTVAEIHKLAQAGCDLVRVAVPTRADTAALPTILRQSPVPLIADVHYHYERAIEAVDAGVHKIRLNPGNITDRRQVDRVIAACRDRGVPVRVGVNEGSVVERKDEAIRREQRARLAADYRRHLVELMVRKLEEYMAIFEAHHFEHVVLSAKSPDPLVAIEANRAIARRFDLPLHLGVTHAGPPETGRIRSIAALATLLAEGIGDTIRISYLGDPVWEVLDAIELLCSLGLRARTTPELIACPACGRAEADVADLVRRVRRHLADVRVPIKVAVMGCVVNGPGECEGADVAVFAGRGCGIIYVQGRRIRTVPTEQIPEALHEEVVRFTERLSHKAGSVRR